MALIIKFSLVALAVGSCLAYDPPLYREPARSMEHARGPAMAPAMAPAMSPAMAPAMSPAMAPAMAPYMAPAMAPYLAPAMAPSMGPAMAPSMGPAMAPSMAPAMAPSMAPAMAPSMAPAMAPSMAPAMAPSMGPAMAPSMGPAMAPSMAPDIAPAMAPAMAPDMAPAMGPSMSPSMASDMAEPQEAPKPYKTGFNADDGYNNRIHHSEESDANGHKKGSFGYSNEDGLYRTVNYIADDQGFRASVLSNEPGLSAEGGASVNIKANPVPAHIKAEMELLRIPKKPDPQVQPAAAIEHVHQQRMQDMNIMAQHQHPMAHHEMRPDQMKAPVASQGQYYGEPRMHHADHPRSALAGDIAY